MMVLQAKSNEIRCVSTQCNCCAPHTDYGVSLAMQLLMSVPHLVEIVHSCSIWHDAAIFACLIHKLFCILGVTAQLAPFPAKQMIKQYRELQQALGDVLIIGVVSYGIARANHMKEHNQDN